MTTVSLVNKKGDVVEVKVLETVDEVWEQITWQQPEYDYDENHRRKIYNKDYLKFTLLNNEPVILSKRFIFHIQ